MVFAIVFVVERAAKCLDYTATVYILHLAVLASYDGFPFAFMWWLVNGSIFLSTVLVSELVCIKIEQQEISLAKETV
jgi:hypothetical protein